MALTLLRSSPRSISHGIELDGTSSHTKSGAVGNLQIHALNTSIVEPWLKIPALRNVEVLKFSAAIHYSFHPHASDTNATSHAKCLHFEEMQPDRAKRAIRDCGSTKGKVEMGKIWTTKGDDFGSRV